MQEKVSDFIKIHWKFKQKNTRSSTGGIKTSIAAISLFLLQ
jgi:hypothetical protein